MLVVTILAAELLLQGAGLLARWQLERGRGLASDTGGFTILCVGDSHTYGYPLDADESYPAQLERALEARYPGIGFEVVNLGIPGLNSSFTANRLRRQMLQLDPDLVMVWVGVNNLWNIVEIEREEDGGRFDDVLQLLFRSKLVKLAAIAWAGAAGHQYEAEGRGGWFEGELPPSGRSPIPPRTHRAHERLAHDLERMAETARGLGVPIVFVTYPFPAADPVAQTIEETGARLAVPVVDTRRIFQRARSNGTPGEALIDRRAGPHPTGLLYGLVVDDMLPFVRVALGLGPGLDPSAMGDVASAGPARP